MGLPGLADAPTSPERKQKGHEPVKRMTPRECVLAAFRGERAPVVWQPRLEHWYNVNKAQGTLPPRYRGMELLEVYDDLGCSVRPYHIFNRTIRAIDDPGLKVRAEERPGQVVYTYETPVGSMEAVERRTGLAQQRSEFPIKGPEDLPKMEWIVRGRRWEFDREKYEQGLREVGERSAPMIYIARVSLQRLFLEYMGFENTIFALHDHPQEMERFIQAIEETDDEMYRVVCESPIPIVNLGDNVHSDMLPPPLFERWILPYYQRRAAQLREAGKFSYSHWDGYVRPLLPYARKCGFDGLEAITPVPQGDVTLEEVKEAFGAELTLVDGLPATDFLVETPVQELVERTRRVLELFWPRLVLGISDEISPPGDIERVRLVSELVADFNRRHQDEMRAA